MTRFETLDQHLKDWREDRQERREIADTILTIAATCCEISEIIARGPLSNNLGAVIGGNADGDAQKKLDVIANDMLVQALKSAPLAAILSEEMDEVLPMDPEALLCLTMDPLDGSSNIDVNVSIGTIFAILPNRPGAKDATDAFMRPANDILAAGYVIYGPQTTLALTVGEGTHVFTLDPDERLFRLTAENLKIPADTSEFAINMSNYDHWERNIRHYIDDCLRGENGPRRRKFNTRWVASLVAECHRILVRGGVFLYPADRRTGYGNGRLRLLYEAVPVAFLVEQAGGYASNGMTRILKVQPVDIHCRVPLIFGSKNEVAQIEQHNDEQYGIGERSPLFSQRGLFRN